MPVVDSESQLRALLASLSGVDAVGVEARAANCLLYTSDAADE